MSDSLHAHHKKCLFFKRALQNKFGKKRLSVLEIGCSNGENLAFKIASNRRFVTGIDIHAPSIKYAKNKKNMFCKFICKDIFKLNQKTKYDAVILSDILEHIDNPLKLLKKSHNLLNTKGLLLICIPNGFGAYEIENFIFRKLGGPQMFSKIKKSKSYSKLPYNHESGHIQFFTEKRIKYLLAKTRFRIVCQRNGGFLGGYLTDFFARKLKLVQPLLSFVDFLPSFLASTWYFICEKK